jgi:mannose-6-phosphate isomerase
LVAEVVAGCRTLVEQSIGGPVGDAVGDGVRGGDWLAAESTLLADGDFPGDIGAVLALLLNPVRLQPGQAIYLAAGNVHAYLRGTGIEILASSDNVLRCGLTPKHVDVAELVRITDFTALDDPIWPPDSPAPGVHKFAVPVPDFLLTEIGASAGSLPLASDGAHIVLCTAGTADLHWVFDGEPQSVALPRGAAAFVCPGVGAALASTTGQTFIASTGI